MEYQTSICDIFPRLGYDIQYLIFKQATLDYFRSTHSVYRIRIASENWEQVIKNVSQGGKLDAGALSSAIVHDEFVEAMQSCPIAYVCRMAHKAFRSTVREMTPVYYFDMSTQELSRLAASLSAQRRPSGETSAMAIGPPDRPNDSTGPSRAGFLKGDASTIYLNFDPSDHNIRLLGPLQPLFLSVKKIMLGYDFWHSDLPHSCLEPYVLLGRDHQYRCPHAAVNPQAAGFSSVLHQTISYSVRDRPSTSDEEFPAWRTGNILVEIARAEMGKPMSCNWRADRDTLVILSHPELVGRLLERMHRFFPKLECISVVAWKLPLRDCREATYSLGSMSETN